MTERERKIEAIFEEVRNWHILTGSGVALRGIYTGTREEVAQYCQDHYLPQGYKIKAI